MIFIRHNIQTNNFEVTQKITHLNLEIVLLNTKSRQEALIYLHKALTLYNTKTYAPLDNFIHHLVQKRLTLTKKIEPKLDEHGTWADDGGNNIQDDLN